MFAYFYFNVNLTCSKSKYNIFYSTQKNITLIFQGYYRKINVKMNIHSFN